MQRYGRGHYSEMSERPNGEYVKYKDHKASTADLLAVCRILLSPVKDEWTGTATCMICNTEKPKHKDNCMIGKAEAAIAAAEG